MRKYLLSLLALCTIALVGCLETTQEVTINADGTGTVLNITDMSAGMAMLKNMEKDPEKLNELNIDSSFSLQQGADSIADLTDDERKLARTGSFKIRSNVKSEQFLMQVSFPFQSLSQVDAYNKLSGKVIAGVLKDKIPAGDEEEEMEAPGKEGSIDDYYITEYGKEVITRKLIKDKYAGLETDASMKNIQEAAAMGISLKANYIINLPRPAKSVEGKNVKLSDDKKKVTISGNMEDFFDDGEAFEFKIKY